MPNKNVKIVMDETSKREFNILSQNEKEVISPEDGDIMNGFVGIFDTLLNQQNMWRDMTADSINYVINALAKGASDVIINMGNVVIKSYDALYEMKDTLVRYKKNVDTYNNNIDRINELNGSLLLEKKENVKGE